MTGNGHIRRRGKNSWELKWDLPPDPRTGKRVTKYKTVRGTKKEAYAELRKILTQLDGGLFIDPGKLTVSEYLDIWIAEKKAAPKTLERWRQMINNHLKPAFGSAKLNRLQSLPIQTVYSEWLESGRKDGKGGLSPQTVKHHHRLMHQAMGQAVSWSLIARNPFSDVKPPKVESAEIQSLDSDDIIKLVEAAKSTPLYVPVLIATATGMRRGEVLGLKWSDIDFAAATLTVDRSLEETKSGLRLKQPKTKRGRRSIAMPGYLIRELHSHKATQLEHILSVRPAYTDDDLVCAKADGSFISPEWLSRRFGEFVATLDIPKVTFHGLRHSHFTQLLKSGVHPKVASERAGHSSVAVTLDIYSHVSENLQHEAASLIDEIMSKNKPK